MICSSGIGFDPLVDGRRLTFGFQGIYQGTAVLYDRQTDSLWMHLTGECFEGPLAGKVLRELATGRHTTWGEWRRTHPGTDVMRPDPKFQPWYFPRESSRAGSSFLPPVFPPTIRDRDDRLPLSALLYGVVVGDLARAYPFDALARDAPVVEEVGGRRIVVFYDPEARSAASYEATFEGAALTFERAAPGRFRDGQGGCVWDLEGVCVEGSRRGARLTRVKGLQAEWYGWYANHRETTVYGR